jgi:glycine betaine/proline transport system substrate-binding protein
MRVWLHWTAIMAIAATAVVVLGYLYNCGSIVTNAPARRASGESGMPVQTPTDTLTPRQEPQAPTIRIGWTAWADAEVVTLMAKVLLEEHLGQRVDRIMTDIGIQYQAVARGDLDLMLMAWLPVTHSNYWKRVQTQVTNLGPVYMGRLGWAVPAYVPEDQLSSITDLTTPEVARRVGGKIQGIDPGSGLMQASERAMSEYGLDRLQLVSASGAAMTAVLDRAIRRKRWVVVTAWQPHWIFAQYDMRFLDDPRGILGGYERIHVLTRKGFQTDYPPEVTEFLARMYLPQDEMAAILLTAQNQPVQDAVAAYIRDHPARIRYWLTGEIEQPTPQ